MWSCASLPAVVTFSLLALSLLVSDCCGRSAPSGHRLAMDELTEFPADTSTSNTAVSTHEPETDGDDGQPSPEHSADPEQLHNCSRCVSHEAARQRRMDSIKSEILSKLGLKGEPNMTRRAFPKIPPLEQYMAAHINRDAADIMSDGPRNYLEDDEGDDFFLAAKRAISFAKEPPSHLNIPPSYKCLYFAFPSNILNSHLEKAHLSVFLRPHRAIGKQTAAAKLTVIVYQVVRAPNSDDSEPRDPTLRKIRETDLKISPQKGGWVTLDVTKIVSQWFRHSRYNLGLVVHAYDTEGKRYEVTGTQESEVSEVISNSDPEESLKPYVEVTVESRSQNRKRRMIGLNCEENSNEVRCCRYPLTVDFEEFGWDWIIAPKRYEANYCSGECPYVFLQKYPHTHLVQQANPQGSAGPCCAPRKMSGISMLYFDDSYNIIYGLLPGMVVDRCGCS